MPLLTWPSKTLPDLDPASLTLDSVVYPHGLGYPDRQPESRVFLGDNLRVMAALLPEFEGRLNLIYTDPPFFSNKQYRVRTGRGEDSRRPQDWQMADGYGDHWEDLDAYLDFLYPRLVLMHRLLTSNGTLYLHLDWHADAYARLLLDEIFGREHLINEIIWTYHGPSPIRRAFNRKHDTILVYAKDDKYTFNVDAVREPYNLNTVKTFLSSPKAGFGKFPDLERGKVPEDWWYFPVVARLHSERTGYPTQKPEALLERVLLASSNSGDLVADFFCGSGTFPLVAARHGRRFLAGDIAWRAVHTVCGRLMDAAQNPFTVYREPGIVIPSILGNFSVTVSGQTVSLINPPALDTWEIDPAWDGMFFRSAIQSHRPNRSGKIAIKMEMPVTATNVSVRAVTVDGNLIQLHVQPVTNSPNRG